MGKIKNLYLWNRNIFNSSVISPFWFSCKTYFEENGQTIDQWAWQDPFLYYKTKDEIFKICEESPPAIFGFSLYIWNHLEADEIAQEIKQRYPDCLIIYGGPQIDIKYSNNFFNEKPWVDLVVPSDVYGEVILTYILDHYDNLNHSNVPEVYYHKKGIKFKSRHEFVKRSFVWPTNIYLKQKEYLNIDTKNSLVIYESTRGCPYKCSYCDWGGGTYTKIVRKPMDTILSELETLSQNKFEYFYFTDANFGIFKDDIKILEYVVSLKEKYGYPTTVSVENAKNNLDRVIEIQKLLIKSKLSFFYKISIQNPDDEIKKNIDRIDIPFTKQLESILELKKEYDAPILIETILGLPGDSYKKTLESINIFYKSNVESHRPAIWNLLPEAPAYSPEYREKYKIQTKWFEIYTHSFRYKSTATVDENVRTIKNERPMFLENVVSTYSYSKYEWCDMLILTMLSGSSNAVGLNFFIEYLTTTHNISPGEFFNILYKDIIGNNKFNVFLNSKLGTLKEQLTKIVDDTNSTQLDFDIGPQFPFWLSPHTYTTFVIMLDPTNFNMTIAEHFGNLTDDSKLRDLGKYISNSMIDVDYDPTTKRKFNTDYNWYSYFNNTKDLIKSEYEYIILDDKLKFVGTSDFEISDYYTYTDRDQKIKQFFYHRASNAARKKYAEHIIENEILYPKK